MLRQWLLDHYFWTPGRLFNMILCCFWKEPKKVSVWVKVWSWSASTSAFPNFCFSQFYCQPCYWISLGSERVEDIYRITHSASGLCSCPELTEVERTQKRFIKSLGLAKGLKKELFLIGTLTSFNDHAYTRESEKLGFCNQRQEDLSSVSIIS